MPAPLISIENRPGYSAINNTLHAIAICTDGVLSNVQKLSAKALEQQDIPSGDSFPVMSALRFLRLVDEQGYKTEAFVELAHATGDERQEKLKSIIKKAYSEVFSRLEDIATANPQQFREAFKDFAYPNLHGKMITLFKGLCREAGLLSDEGQTRQTPDTQHIDTRTPLMQVSSTNVLEGYEAMPEPLSASLNGHISVRDYAMIEGLLDAIEVLRQLPNSPKWTEANRPSWLKAIAINVNLLQTMLEGKE